MKTHIVRHYPAVDIKFLANDREVTVPNDFRHLNLERAEGVTLKFREKFQTDGPHDVRLRAYSKALRTRYSMLLSTVGICDGPTVLIPKLSIGSDADSWIMLGAFQKHDIKVGDYSEEEIAACDRIGERGAAAIRAKEQELGITEGETMYFTHAPICSFFALHLAGNPADARELLLKTPTGEGDRLVVEGNKVTFVPIEG